ncbi:hypothetical protein RUM44_010178 [Polyplax serrata]|uniref:Uncharacterized protein n=1 Tax=Polyplax serrata TaxID=468196 RepID=A0ABR1AUU9_POLSC
MDQGSFYMGFPGFEWPCVRIVFLEGPGNFLATLRKKFYHPSSEIRLVTTPLKTSAELTELPVKKRGDRHVWTFPVLADCHGSYAKATMCHTKALAVAVRVRPDRRFAFTSRKGQDQPETPEEEEEKEASWVSVKPPVELSDRCRRDQSASRVAMKGFFEINQLNRSRHDDVTTYDFSACEISTRLGTRSDLETTMDNDQNEPTR